MKKSDKILVAILFLALNLGFLYFISTFFNVSYGVLTISFIGIVAAIDINKRIKNAKILKAERKKIEKEEQLKKEEQKKKIEIKNRKKEEAIKKQRRMTEHNRYK